ncbi:MAG: haloacid dehalogenase [Anaerolineae bacterium]|nr:MAG: haloacid dehalogenase [Anaerolineae bacterium]
MDRLEEIVERIQAELEAKNEARDLTLRRSRALIRRCANTIRAIHRTEFESAGESLALARQAAEEMIQEIEDHPDLYHTGYTQDALKEFVEASVTFALITGAPLPTPQELNVESAAYLRGLAEAASELRRHILDIIRHSHSERAERLLGHMEEIYGHLVTIDFPDAITGRLRRNTDVLRAVLERTRGDVTTSLRQSQLQAALRSLEARLSASDEKG